MPTAATQAIFAAISAGDVAAITALLDADPGHVHARQTDPVHGEFTLLQFAAANGQLAACRLLVERGAEVYTNPMSTYPPVMHAAWGKHDDVVKYFLEEIPARRWARTAWA